MWETFSNIIFPQTQQVTNGCKGIQGKNLHILISNPFLTMLPTQTAKLRETSEFNKSNRL